MIFLPHTNTVILLEPYCGTITEPGLPVQYTCIYVQRMTRPQSSRETRSRQARGNGKEEIGKADYLFLSFPLSRCRASFSRPIRAGEKVLKDDWRRVSQKR